MAMSVGGEKLLEELWAAYALCVRGSKLPWAEPVCPRCGRHASTEPEDPAYPHLVEVGVPGSRKYRPVLPVQNERLDAGDEVPKAPKLCKKCAGKLL